MNKGRFMGIIFITLPVLFIFTFIGLAMAGVGYDSNGNNLLCLIGCTGSLIPWLALLGKGIELYCQNSPNLEDHY